MVPTTGDRVTVTFVGVIDADGDLECDGGLISSRQLLFADRIDRVNDPLPTTRGSVITMNDGCSAILGVNGWYDDEGFFREPDGDERIVFLAPSSLYPKF